MTAVAAPPSRLGALAERHGGRGILLALAVIVLLGFALRANSALSPLDVRPGSDSAVYASVAEQIYEHQRFAIPGAVSPYDWSPGAPILYAGVYYATGGVHPGAVRLFVALLGALTIVLVYLIGRRLAGPIAGLVGAGLLAFYPTTIYFTGKLLSEPLAMLTLAGTVLSFMWAAEEGRSRWAWAVPGLLLGLTALARPEYLVFVVIFALLALWRRGLAAAAILAVAFALPVAPWSAHVSSVEGRFVPISTGGGKALFIGTYLPGNGIHLDVKRVLIARYLHKTNVSATELSRISMTPLLNRVARRYPDLPRDAALQRVGKQNASHYLAHQPLDFAGMIAGKMWHMWQGSGAAGRSLAGGAYHYLALVLGLIGLAVLALRRRWEVVPLVLLIAGITVLGGLLLAGTRRNVSLMPLVMAAAGVTVTALVHRIWSRMPSRYLAPPCES